MARFSICIRLAYVSVSNGQVPALVMLAIWGYRKARSHTNFYKALHDTDLEQVGGALMSVWGISSTATAFLHVILLCASSISYEFNSQYPMNSTVNIL
jgi:hypothetical protein